MWILFQDFIIYIIEFWPIYANDRNHLYKSDKDYLRTFPAEISKTSFNSFGEEAF